MKHLSLSLAAAMLAASAISHAATYTVTRADGSPLNGTLNWAIASANANPGPDVVEFAIGSGPVTVYASGSLYVNSPVTIDGTTQPGYDGTPLISLQRPDAPWDSQMSISSGACASTVRGIAFNGVNSLAGLTVYTFGATIDNCWFGVTRDGGILGSGPTAIRSGDGVFTINDLHIKNCMFGNYQTAIRLLKNTNAEILDCAIGTDHTGAAQFPINGPGILVRDSTGTFIGSSPSGDGNIITNCLGEGIGILESFDTIMLQNRIFNNLGMAIDMGIDGYVHYNDPGDTDIPSGGQQNYPELSSVRRENGTVRVEGMLKSTASTNFVVEVFASENRGITGQGEAQYEIGIIDVTTNASGEGTFSEVLPDTLPSQVALYYSATATRTDSSWGTSEISDGLNAEYSSLFVGKNLNTDPGWIPSGIDSGPEYVVDPSSPDDVDLIRESGYLGVEVRPSPTRNRVAGWRNPALMQMPLVQDSNMFVRGKFYIFASNPMDAPLNTVPNFRIRLESEGAVLASNTYQYANTGRTSPAYEPYYGLLNNPDLEDRVGGSLRPSDNPLKPSLYRVDFAPPYSAASGGTNIGATFEAMSMEDPADGLLALTEIQVATYYAGAFSADLSYFHSADIEAAAGLPTSSTLTQSPGMFNVEADFQAGRRQRLDLVGEVPASELATVTQTGTGTVLDTGQVPDDRGGIAVFSVAAPDNVSAPRIEPNKRYAGLFIVSSDMPAVSTTPGEEVQGGFSFQLQTAGGAVTTRLEYVGPAALGGGPGSPGRALLEAGLPGRDSQHWYLPYYPFPPGEHGGVYLCLMSSPLSQDIRPESPGDLGPLADEPGPGIDSQSFRDISIGVNALQQPTSLRIDANTVVPWAPPNRARIRIGAMIIAESPEIYDGGYGY